MTVSPDGLFIVCVLCAIFGFGMGYCAGALNERDKQRADCGIREDA